MDELEKRISALETLWIEIGPFLDPGALDDAERSIRDGLAQDIGADEADCRRHAIHLIEVARQRYVGHAWVLRPKS